MAWKSRLNHDLNHKKHQIGEGARARGKCLIGGLFFTAALALQALARNVSWFGEWYGGDVYPILVRVFGGFFGLFPFSVVELGLYALVVGGLGYGSFWIWKGIHGSFSQALARIGAGAFLLLGALVFFYTANCGINYYRTPFSASLDLDLGGFSQEELEGLCRLLKEELKAAARAVMEEQGSLAPDKVLCQTFPSQAREDMEKLSEQYPQLSAAYPAPKPVAVSEILSIQSLSGVYAPFTIEANYNQDMPAYNIPHTACHELSHLTGFMREEEANFIGYLACIGSDSLYSRYSGFAVGFIYANNALFGTNPQLASELHKDLLPEIQDDFQKNNEFWEQYEGKISEASTKLNDTYLKANSQVEGVKSYGRMVDLMLAYYQKSFSENP